MHDSTPHAAKGIRRRPDVTCHAQSVSGSAGAVLRDPLTSRLFELREYELAIWDLLDGRRSFEEIRRAFASRFAPAKITSEEILAFVHRLHHANLVLTDDAQAGTRYWQRSREQTQRETIQRWLRWWAIRLPAVDPSRWLARIQPLAAWLFTPAAVMASIALIGSALSLLALRWDECLQRISKLEAFLTPQSLIWFGVALAIVKGCHELGHALLCQHFGGRCREMGVMLFFFTPCLYSNVSDAWLFRSRWRRMAVSAAGIWVELVIASIGFLLWWWVAPGTWSAILLRLCLVCSLHTVLINGNPLLQYDGYFLLSDALGISNLHERSRAAWSNWFRRWWTNDLTVTSIGTTSGRWAFMGYAIASFIYRFLLIASAMVLMVRLGQHWNLPSVGNSLALLFAASVVGPNLFAGSRAIESARQGGSLRPWRMLPALLMLFVAMLLVSVIPMPRSILAPATIRPANAAWIYTTIPGRIERSLPGGVRVGVDDELVRLDDPALRYEIAELTTERDQAAVRLQNLRARQADDATAALLLPSAEARLQDLQARCSQRLHDARGLSCRTPIAGTLFPPPEGREYEEDEPEKRTTIPPLDPRSRGGYLDRGTLIGIVGDPHRLEAIVLVPQEDLAALRVGHAVRVSVAAAGPRSLAGSIAEISQSPIEFLPDDLIGSIEPITTDAHGNVRPIDTMHEVRVQLAPSSVAVPIGAQGRARIFVDREPLSNRVVRALQSLFKPRND